MFSSNQIRTNIFYYYFLKGILYSIRLFPTIVSRYVLLRYVAINYAQTNALGSNGTRYSVQNSLLEYCHSYMLVSCH